MLDTIKDLLKTRGAQLLARYAAMGLVALATKLGVEVKDAESAGMAVATLVVGAILLGIDHWAHKEIKKDEAK